MKIPKCKHQPADRTSRTVRLNSRQCELLKKYLTAFALRCRKDCEEQAVINNVDLLRQSVPMSPQTFTLEVFAHDWPVLSTALRPDGNNPAKGTDDARAYALYQYLRRHLPFRVK